MQASNRNVIFAASIVVPAIALAVSPTGLPLAQTQPLGRSINPTESGKDITQHLQWIIDHSGDNSVGDQGEDVIIPPGDYLISSSIVVPGTRPLVIEGAGKDITRLKLTADLGPGSAIITAKPTEKWPATVKNVTLLGVGAGAIGIAPCQTSGIRMHSTWTVENVGVGRCYAGLIIDGNHQRIENCSLGANYYGAYFVKPYDGSSGDQFFEDTDFTGTLFAGIACDGYQTIEGNTFVRCHTGFEPYAFYREPGVHRPQWIVACDFVNTQIEGVGNAQFWDDDGVSVIVQNDFSECSSNGMYGFAIRNRPTDMLWHAGGISANVFTLCLAPGSMSARNIIGNHWILDANVFQPSKHLFTPGSLTVSEGAAGLYGNTIESGDATGTIMESEASLAPGQPVEEDPADPTGYACRAFTNTGQPLLGVAETTCLPDQPVVVVQKGVIPDIPVDASVRPGKWVKAEGPTIVASTTSTGPDVIGYAVFAPGNHRATIRLKSDF